MIKIKLLTDKINDLVSWCKSHEHSGVITAVTGGSGTPAVGTPGNTGHAVVGPDIFNIDDYENTKFKH